ncbi:MAG TPA: alpha/beta hydrolase [Acidocella sp.]|nr:alpha/beta hydrolase [Acidocella sp.]
MEIATRLVQANGINIQVAELGAGPPLLLLHGWPEFWFTWAKVMPLLADKFRLIAPDLRGFGGSDKIPAGYSKEMTAEQHAEDLAALLDVLGLTGAGLPGVGLVAHDIGALIGQTLIRNFPGRVRKFLAFDCPYPGIGRRWIEGGQLKSSWYMWFHQTRLAMELVGHSRETLEIYLRYVLVGGSQNKQAFDDNFGVFVDNMMAPGNLQGGFNWYISTARAVAPPATPITIPTRILWPERDAVFPVAWMDQLGAFFSDLQAEVFAGVGHFPHQEKPVAAAAAIREFFT